MRSLTAALLVSTMMSTAAITASTAQTTPPPAPPIAPATPAAPLAPPVPSAPPAPAATSATQPKAEDPAAEARRSVSVDRAAMLDAHLAALHAGLTLAPGQEKDWPPVEQAIRGFAAMRDTLDRPMAGRPGARDGAAREGGSDGNPVAGLKIFSDHLLMRAQALEALADAVDPLYAGLDADQKRRLPMLLRDMAPPVGPVAQMVARMAEGEGERDRPGDERMDRMDRHEGFDRERGEPRWHRGEHGMSDGGMSWRGMERPDRDARGMDGRWPGRDEERAWDRGGMAERHGPPRDEDGADDRGEMQ